MSEEDQVTVDMAVHSLETALADLERLSDSPANRAALRSDRNRIGKCSLRLHFLMLRVADTREEAA